MSTYYTVACRTCKKRLGLAGVGNPALDEKIGYFSRWTHGGHDIIVLHDITGWDEEYDKLYDEIADYEVEKSE